MYGRPWSSDLTHRVTNSVEMPADKLLLRLPYAVVLHVFAVEVLDPYPPNVKTIEVTEGGFCPSRLAKPPGDIQNVYCRLTGSLTVIDHRIVFMLPSALCY